MDQLKIELDQEREYTAHILEEVGKILYYYKVWDIGT